MAPGIQLILPGDFQEGAWPVSGCQCANPWTKVRSFIGNAALLPKNLVSPASTLTSVLTSGIGNTVMGSLENNALWSLALLLLLMSLAFNLLIRWIGKKGELNK